MIGIVIAAHKKMGTEILNAAVGIIGPLENVESVEFGYDESPEEAVDRLYEAVKRVDDGSGVLVLTDMFGGTPTNRSLALLKRSSIEIIAGVNLPMVLKAHTARMGMGLRELTEFLRDYGARNIVVASDFFSCRDFPGK